MIVIGGDVDVGYVFGYVFVLVVMFVVVVCGVKVGKGVVL